MKNKTLVLGSFVLALLALSGCGQPGPSPTPIPTPIPEPALIAFLSNRDIFVANADGSNQTNLTNNGIDDGLLGFSWSPDGSKIAFTSSRSGNQDDIYVTGSDGSNQTSLTDGLGEYYSPLWSPDGIRIVFLSKLCCSDICVMNADGTGRLTLASNPMGDHLGSWSPDGRKIAFVSSRDGNDEIYVMDADGSNLLNLTNHPAGDFRPQWSPDGTRIAFVSNRDGNSEIYVMDSDGSNQTRLTNNPAEPVPSPIRSGAEVYQTVSVTWFDDSPVWSPSGNRIAFVSIRSGEYEIYVMNSDGSGQTCLTPGWSMCQNPSWSPDGTKLAFESMRPNGVWDIYVVNADGADLKLLISNGRSFAWSPVTQAR